MLNVFAIAALCALLAVELSAQLPALSPAHLNPAIAKLASGKTVMVKQGGNAQLKLGDAVPVSFKSAEAHVFGANGLRLNA